MNITTGHWCEPEKHHKGWFRFFRFYGGNIEIWFGHKWIEIEDLPMRNGRGRFMNLPSWFTLIFGGTDRLPKSQGGGSRWRPNLYRSVRKYYSEDWSGKYTLREWVTR